MSENNTNNRIATTDKGLFLSSLSAAQKKDELCLFYQPRFDLSAGSATVLESLMRWQRPGVGLIYPEVFSQIVEENALNYQLDLWAFERCCRDLWHLREHVNPAIKLAVNLSVRSCESVYISQKIIDLSEQYGLSLSDFIIDISGSIRMTDRRKVEAFCNTLIEHGAVFCADNFGDGCLSLVDVELLPVQQLKIDRALIERIGVSKRSEHLVMHIIRIAKDLGLKPVALGVENKTQLNILRQYGCDDMQGHLFSPPVMLERIQAATLSL